MHPRWIAFYAHWIGYYGGADSLEEIVRRSGCGDARPKRGEKPGREQPHKRMLGSRNTTGRVGVSFRKDRGTYKATLVADGVRHESAHKTFKEACEAREEMERKYLNREGA
ncbi:hypothetical protein PVS_45 [Vibrio phage vB_VspS_VS-ABTNL-3]|nr:hypothetical protein PVS_45 [Vibrio phage vB_VspS_VS-ABTNL-3]